MPEWKKTVRVAEKTCENWTIHQIWILLKTGTFPVFVIVVVEVQWVMGVNNTKGLLLIKTLRHLNGFIRALPCSDQNGLIVYQNNIIW